MSNFLQPGESSIRAIFSLGKFYNIPEYQRPYVWKEEQIHNLLDDVDKAFNQDPNHKYFLGCMIWNTKKGVLQGQPYEYNDILDGQQRFITLYLLQAVIRDLSNREQLHQTVATRLWQEANPLDGNPERHRMEFSIREDDQEFIKQFVIEQGGTLREAELKHASKQKEAGTSIRHMSGGALLMHAWWEEKRAKLASDTEFQDYLFRYYSYLSNNVLVIHLATNDNVDDAYNLFTVLNSRGLQLRTSDILRAQNLRAIDDEKQRKTYAARWEEYQNELESPYNSFDEFLWALVFIVIKYRGDINLSLTKAFNSIYAKGTIHPGKSTFDFIGRYVNHLSAITTTDYDSKEGGCFFSNLNFILATTYSNNYMVLLMYYRECFGENQLLDFMIKVDNIFSASWLTNNRNLQQRIFILLRRMEETSKNQSNKALAAAQFLADDALRFDFDDEKATTAIDMDVFYQMLNEEGWGSFSGTKINKTRYLLLKLDLLLGHRDMEMTFNKTFATVEHILPQKIQNTIWDVPAEDHQKWLHRLGNIVLIDKRKNSSIGNAPYQVKKDKYKVHFDSRANTNYVFQTFSEWNLSTIQQNHERVVSLLRQYYEGNSLATLQKIWHNQK